MFIDIGSLAPDGIRFDESLRLPPLPLEGADPIPVLGARLCGSACPGTRGVEFRARLEARLGLECSRCLESFEKSVDSDFELILVPDAVEFGLDETRMDKRDSLLFYTEGGRAELEAIAREQIYLNLPLKPVCGAECQGLCPTCGANRNRLQCGCRSQEVDPRLAPLLDIKKKLGES
jgi:uncharacterized protein